MITAIIASFLGAVCMALMVTTDRLMVGDCYQGKSNQAWFVSSLAGSAFGLILTAIVWLGSVHFGLVDSIQALFVFAYELLFWKGLAALVVGALGVQILLHYFRCFEENAHSAAIAAWFAATPIFVFVGMLLFGAVVHINGVSATSTEPIWVLGVILATGGLILFERITGGPAGNVKKYKNELVLLLVFNVLYAVALKQTFSIERTGPGMLEAIALMPFYWIGFAAGMRVMISKKERDAFRNNWHKRIRYFVIPILFVEVIGMLVFFFEYIAFTSLDPSLVTIIMGAHVFLVYIFDLMLGRLRHRMELRNQRKLYIAGMRILQHKLPQPKLNLAVVCAELIAILTATAGISLAVTHAAF